MKKTFTALLLAMISGGLLAGEKTIDWAALNGGTPLKAFRMQNTTEVFEDGASRFTGDRADVTISVEDGKFKMLVHSSNNGGQRSYGYCFTNDCGLLLREVRIVSAPYRYDSTSTSGVGVRYRLVVTAGGKSFSVPSTNTVIRGEWSTIDFDLTEAYNTFSANYAAAASSPVTAVRFYPYSAGSSITSNSDEGSGGSQRLYANDTLVIGSFTFTCPDAKASVASFNANGGDPVEDVSTDASGNFTFPSATRAGYTFCGWYRDGYVFQAGSEAMLVMDAEYVAGWKNANPSDGLIATSVDYRKELDLPMAYGTCCGVLSADTISYDPLTDICRGIRAGVYEIDAEMVDAGSTTNFLLSGKSGNAGNNGPYLKLPVVGVKVSDVYTIKIPYRTTANALASERLSVYYKVGSTWRHVQSEDFMQRSTAGEFHTATVKLAAALGEVTYEQIKDSQISEWKLYPYTLDANGAGGNRSAIPFTNGVTLELGRFELVGEHDSGLVLIVR